MRIPSGSTSCRIYFVAQDAAGARLTGLSNFTVFRSRNGSGDAAYTSPTVTEIGAANMPGVYALLVDEDTTIAGASDSEEYCAHITHEGMEPVTRTVELYRRPVTAGHTLAVDANGRGDANVDAAGVRGAVGLANPNLDTQLSGLSTGIAGRASQASVDDLPTNDELATALAAVDDAVLAAVANVQADTNDIQVRLPAALVGGRIDASVGAMDANTITAAAVAADAVAELQAGLATAAAVDALPTNAELATALDPLPTNAELTTALAAADDAVLAAIGALNDLSAAEAKAEADQALVDAGVTPAVTGRIDAAVSSRLASASYTAPDNAGIAAIEDTAAKLDTAVEADGGVWRFTANALEEAPTGAGGGGGLDAAGVRAAVGLAAANLDTQLAAKASQASVDALPTVVQIKAQADQALGDAGVSTTVMGRLDVAVSSRLATASYAAPDNAGILTAIGTRLAASAYTAPLSAGQTKAQADQALADAGVTVAAMSRLDDTVSSRLAAVSYAAPPTLEAINAEVDQALVDAGVSPTVMGRLDAAVSSRLAAASYVAPNNAGIAAIDSRLPPQPAAVGNPMTLTAAYDFARGDVAMPESYAANGAAPTPIQALYALHQKDSVFVIEGTAWTVRRLDGVTPAFVLTLNSETAPTGAARS